MAGAKARAAAKRNDRSMGAKGMPIRHERKRMRATVVEWDGTKLAGVAESRSGKRRFRITAEELVNGPWRPWHGHSQMSRERSAPDIRREREAIAAAVGGVAMPVETAAERDALKQTYPGRGWPPGWLTAALLGQPWGAKRRQAW